VRHILDIDFNDRATALWREYGETAIAEFVKKNPGRRPSMWWRYSAVEPRRQVGGATKRPHESGLAYGIRVYYDPLGKIANNPPIYETEAEYLERLGLWLRGERERLLATTPD
jgi:hypothetical protein